MDNKFNTKFKGELNPLDENNFANLFSVVYLGNNSYFNINKTINIKNVNDIDSSKYFTYEIVEGDTWTSISFKFYNTYKLWWLICKFNNIINPFTELTVGTFIKILKPNYADMILKNIRDN